MKTPSWLKDYIKDEAQPAEAAVVTLDGPAAGGESSLRLDLVDKADLERLTTALAAHDSERRKQTNAATVERAHELLQAVCLTLLVGPIEQSAQPHASPLHAQARTLLRRDDAQMFPEARACALWLDGAAGQTSPDAADQFAALLRYSLWWPVRALVYRALAGQGHRRLLADVLARESSLTLDQADAWLEAAHAAELEEGWTARIVDHADELLPAAQRDQWLALLKLETTLACVDLSNDKARAAAVERELAPLADLPIEAAPRTFAEAVMRRTAACAAAALARARLAARHDDGSAIMSAAGQLLPDWEREYLKACARWQSNDLLSASKALEEALNLSPNQTCLKLALATLLAPRLPETAMKVLNDNSPTRELLIALTTLLARLRRFDEAEQTLNRTARGTPPGHEAARYTWARAAAQYRERELVLRGALAEERGDSSTASKAWRRVYAAEQSKWLIDNLRKSLREVRQLYATRRELAALGNSQSWLRNVLQQRLKRGCYAISKLPLEDDALFFRAATMVDVFPRRAIRDFQTLLRHRTWIEKERRAGGARIIFAGDVLLRLGRPEDAGNAYGLTRVSPTPELKERLAVAGMFAQVGARADAGTLATAVESADVQSPNSPWPRLLAALGLLLAGDELGARAQIATGKERGADANTCRQLEIMCESLSGLSVMPEGEIEPLKQTNDPRAVARLLCSMEVEPGRTSALEQALGAGWLHGHALNPYVISSRLLTAWCEDGEWEKALEYADELAQADLAWASELAALMRVRHALDRANRGELGAAEAELQELEALLQVATA